MRYFILFTLLPLFLSACSKKDGGAAVPCKPNAYLEAFDLEVYRSRGKWDNRIVIPAYSVVRSQSQTQIVLDTGDVLPGETDSSIEQNSNVIVVDLLKNKIDYDGTTMSIERDLIRARPTFS